jgi:hypothetical protein
MRHRIGVGNSIGLGNSDPVELDNKGNPPSREVSEKAIEVYFEHWEGFDYQWGKETLSLGIEPAYQGEDLLIITLHKDKEKSSITEGRAFGYYGSGIRKKTRVYGDYVYNSKFVRFVDQVHGLVFGGAK